MINHILGRKLRKIIIPLILVTVLVISVSASFIPLAFADPDPGEVWATDADGIKKEVFNPTDTVYVKGVGLRKGLKYKISIVEDTGTQIKSGDPIPTNNIVAWKVITTDLQDGSFGPEDIWIQPLMPGCYDVFADCLEEGTQGYYDPGIDAKDEESPLVTTAGFFVIPEIPLGTLTGLLASFSATLIIKRKRIF